MAPLKRASYTSTVSVTVIRNDFKDSGTSLKQMGELDTGE